MSDEYQLRKDIDRIYGDIYTLQGNELDVYKKKDIDNTLSEDYYDKSEVDVKLNKLIDMVYPIGSIYMSVNTVNPSTLFGGVWEKIEDKFLLASGNTYANGSTGGSANAVVVSHKHNYSRNYILTTDGSGVSRISTAGETGTKVSNLLQSNDTIYRNEIEYSGEDGTGKNMPPYLVVNVWERVQ